MIRKIATLLMLVCTLSMAAQLTSQPRLVQENTQDLVVYYHADQGNLGLLDQPASAQLYAHTGVITNSSTSPSDWKYAPEWGDNSAKYKLEYVSPNLWKLNIGDIRSYYGITDPNVTVKKLAFVFRTADKTAEGKGENGADMYIDVLGPGLQVSMSSSSSSNVIQPTQSQLTFDLYCTERATLTIDVNGTVIGTATNTTQLTASYDFTSDGNYTVTGSAVTPSGTVSTTMNLVRLVPSPAADYPGGTPRMGAVRNADGSVTFCLAAPLKTNAMIVGSWNNYAMETSSTMAYQDYQGDRYFWITIPALESGRDYMYYYLVDGSIRVGDPYARLVLDPYHDKSIPSSVYPDLPPYPYDMVTDVPLAIYNDKINDYNWKVKNFARPDKDNLFIYELLVRDFTGTEGKALGDGTIRGAMEKIPYLKALGVNAVELLPINEFNGNISWGYNPNFYFAPDKAYGTPDDYKAFIDECHRNGMAVILDMVFNQTDWLHPWYRMYPVGQNPFYNADAPHAYSVLNDWNQGYPLVRRQFCDVLQYWLTEYHVDGFRFDLVKGLGNNSSYPNAGDSATGQYNQSRIDNMRELQLAMEQVTPDAYFINENLATAPEENAMAAFGQLNWANINHNGIQYAKGEQAESGLDRFYAPRDGRTAYSTVSYLESHDEQRLAYEQNTVGATGVRGNLGVSMQRLGAAAAQMMMAPGAHMIWQFSELGNATSTKNDNGSNNVDPKVVRWNYFDKKERRGLYQSYAELAGIRNANPEMFDRSTEVNINCGEKAWANGRYIILNHGDKQIMLAVNPNISGAPLSIALPFKSRNNSDYHLLSASYDSTPTFDAAAGTVTVAPNCYAVIGSRSLTDVDEIRDITPGLAVRGGEGCLYIDHADEPVSIYTISGVEVGNCQATDAVTIMMPRGIYILRCGHHSAKIAVR